MITKIAFLEDFCENPIFYIMCNGKKGYIDIITGEERKKRRMLLGLSA